MEDIVQTAGAIAKAAGETGMTRDDLGKAKDLLQKFGDERDRLFDQMLSLLSKPDGDGITEAWKDLSEKGKGQIALVADVLVKVKAANMGLIQQCNDELKSIRDTNGEMQSSLNESLEETKADLLDLVNTLASKANDKTLTAWMKERQAKDYIKKWNEGIVRRTDDNLKGAQQKGALKKQILDRTEMLGNAREQLDEKWIEEMYRSGEDGTKALAGSGETGDYRALDWARFGEGCLEPLAEIRDAATEQSKTVFEELLPAF